MSGVKIQGSVVNISSTTFCVTLIPSEWGLKEDLMDSEWESESFFFFWIEPEREMLCENQPPVCQAGFTHAASAFSFICKTNNAALSSLRVTLCKVDKKTRLVEIRWRYRAVRVCNGCVVNRIREQRHIMASHHPAALMFEDRNSPPHLCRFSSSSRVPQTFLSSLRNGAYKMELLMLSTCVTYLHTPVVH